MWSYIPAPSCDQTHSIHNGSIPTPFPLSHWKITSMGHIGHTYQPQCCDHLLSSTNSTSHTLYWNSSLRASIGVFGIPLNRLVPIQPGKIKSGLLGNVKYSTTNSAGSLPFGKIKGQNGDEIHCGATKVPLAPQFWACLIVWGIR